MGVFDDIRLGWAGQEYVIPAHRVMGAIARVEDVITLAELMRAEGRQTLPLAKVACAFGALLRYAGARVEDEAVYQGMFAGDGTGRDAAVAAVTALLTMMVPPATIQEGAPRGNVRPAASPKRSSRRPTSSRSATGKSGRKTSGG